MGVERLYLASIGVITLGVDSVIMDFSYAQSTTVNYLSRFTPKPTVERQKLPVIARINQKIFEQFYLM